jgi:hypothetical protein
MKYPNDGLGETEIIFSQLVSPQSRFDQCNPKYMRMLYEYTLHSNPKNE